MNRDEKRERLKRIRHFFTGNVFTREEVARMANHFAQIDYAVKTNVPQHSTQPR